MGNLRVKNSLYVISALIPFLLAACGGGGGGGSGGGSTGPVSSTLSFPFKAIVDSERVTNRYQTGTISGSTISSPTVTFGGNYTANSVYSANNVFSYKPIGSSITTNVNASSVTTTVALTLNNFSNGAGSQTANSTVSSYFDAQGVLIGNIADSTTYYLTTSGGAVPVSGMVGDQGQLYAQNIFYTSYGGISVKCGTEVSTYLVQPDTASTVIVKSVITRSITDSSCGTSSTETSYTRFTQTSSKSLYSDVANSSFIFRLTVN